MTKATGFGGLGLRPNIGHNKYLAYNISIFGFMDTAKAMDVLDLKFDKGHRLWWPRP